MEAILRHDKEVSRLILQIITGNEEKDAIFALNKGDAENFMSLLQIVSIIFSKLLLLRYLIF